MCLRLKKKVCADLPPCRDWACETVRHCRSVRVDWRRLAASSQSQATNDAAASERPDHSDTLQPTVYLDRLCWSPQRNLLKWIMRRGAVLARWWVCNGTVHSSIVVGTCCAVLYCAQCAVCVRSTCCSRSAALHEFTLVASHTALFCSFTNLLHAP